MSPEKIEASICRRIRSRHFFIPSPFTGLFPAGCSHGQCPAKRYPASARPLRQPQNPAGESRLMKPSLFVTPHPIAGRVQGRLWRRQGGFAIVLIALAQGMNIDMIDNFTDNILQLVIISAEI